MHSKLLPLFAVLLACLLSSASCRNPRSLAPKISQDDSLGLSLSLDTSADRATPLSPRATPLSPSTARYYRLLQDTNTNTDGTDPCTELHGILQQAPKATFYTDPLVLVRPTQWTRCAHAVPSRDDSQASDLENVILYLTNFYGLLHYAKNLNSDPRMHLEYDVIAELQAMKEVQWDSAVEFYTNLHLAGRKLNDAHTVIDSDPFMVHQLALDLVALWDGEGPAVFIAPEALQSVGIVGLASQPPFSFDGSQYYDAKVLQIEGQDAYEYLHQWAKDHAGNYVNQGQRLNAAVAKQGWSFNGDTFSLSVNLGTFGHRQLTPDADQVNLRVLLPGSDSPEEIQVPWLSGTRESNIKYFETTETFSHKFWEKDPSLLNADSLRPPMDPPPRLWQKYLQCKGTEATSQDRGKTKRISGESDLWPVFVLRGGKTCAVVIGSFSDRVMPGVDDARFLSETVKAVNTVNGAGCLQVIIDLRGNGGGYLHWGNWMLQIVVGTSNLDAAPGGDRIFDFSHFLADTDFVKELSRRDLANYDAKTKLLPDEALFPAADTLVDKLVSMPGVEGKYTEMFKMALPHVEKFSVSASKPAFGDRQLLLLSDGLCYSTCSTFSTALRRRFCVPLVTVGGMPDAEISFQGGGGGFVADAASLWSTWNTTDLANREDAPKMFAGPIGLDMRNAIGFFDPEDPLPIELTYLGGDHHVHYTLENVDNLEGIYEEAAKYFDVPGRVQQRFHL